MAALVLQRSPEMQAAETRSKNKRGDQRRLTGYRGVNQALDPPLQRGQGLVLVPGHLQVQAASHSSDTTRISPPETAFAITA